MHARRSGKRGSEGARNGTYARRSMIGAQFFSAMKARKSRRAFSMHFLYSSSTIGAGILITLSCSSPNTLQLERLSPDEEAFPSKCCGCLDAGRRREARKEESRGAPYRGCVCVSVCAREMMRLNQQNIFFKCQKPIM